MIKKFLIGSMLWLMGCTFVYAQGIVIKVRAINPLDIAAMAPIRYPLSKEIKKEDVLMMRYYTTGGKSSDVDKNLADEGQMIEVENIEGQEELKEPLLDVVFEFGEDMDGDAEGESILEQVEEESDEWSIDAMLEFDEKQGHYYIVKEVMLEPKEIITLEIDVRDVWVISEKQIERLNSKLHNLVPWVISSESEEEQFQNETVVMLVKEIVNQLDTISKRQDQYTVLKMGVEKHIRMYEKNSDMVIQVAEDLEMLEGLLEEVIYDE